MSPTSEGTNLEILPLINFAKNSDGLISVVAVGYNLILEFRLADVFWVQAVNSRVEAWGFALCFASSEADSVCCEDCDECQPPTGGETPPEI